MMGKSRMKLNPVYTNDLYVDTPDTATKLLERVHTRNSNERVRNKRCDLERAKRKGNLKAKSDSLVRERCRR